MPYEITLNGFNPETSETDHLILWVDAPSLSAIESFTTTAEFTSKHPEGVSTIRPMAFDPNGEGIDYVLPRHSIAVTAHFPL